MPQQGNPHPQPSPARGHRPQHEKGERGLDFSQDLERFLLPPPVGSVVPPGARRRAGSDILYPAKRGWGGGWEAGGSARG